MHANVGVAWIRVRKKAGRNAAGKKACGDAEYQRTHDHDVRLFDQKSAPTYIALCGSFEQAVKPIEKSPQQSVALILRLEEQGRKRWTQRERIESGKQHGNRDGDGELLIELACDSGNERRRHEYPREH